jgi:hypothetical protein
MTYTEVYYLKHGQTIYHLTSKNKDGTPVRARVTGKTKYWKTIPGKFRRPIKYGLNQHLALTEVNAADWTTDYALANKSK